MINPALAFIPKFRYAPHGDFPRGSVKTDVDNSSSTKLGHIDVLNASGNYIGGVVFGINSPKPPRAKKFFGNSLKRYESSFVSAANIDDARADGWKVTPGKIQRLRSSAYAKLVYVDFKVIDAVEAQDGNPAAAALTIKYGWKMPLYQYNKLLASDKAILGIEDYSDNDAKEIVIGANNPKPYRASKSVVADGQLLTITTFVASNKRDSLSGGWA